jgi:hypothetical protein
VYQNYESNAIRKGRETTKHDTKYSAKMRSKASKKKKKKLCNKKSEDLKTMSIQNKNSQHKSIQNSVLRNVMNIEVHILARQRTNSKVHKSSTCAKQQQICQGL